MYQHCTSLSSIISTRLQQCLAGRYFLMRPADCGASYVLYMSGCLVVRSAISFFSRDGVFMRRNNRSMTLTALGTLIIAATIGKFTLGFQWMIRPFTECSLPSIQHPFLLSDNRHFTFYVWRRVFLSHPIIPFI